MAELTRIINIVVAIVYMNYFTYNCIACILHLIITTYCLNFKDSTF